NNPDGREGRLMYLRIHPCRSPDTWAFGMPCRRWGSITEAGSLVSQSCKTRGTSTQRGSACHLAVQSCSVVQHGHWIGRPVTLPNREAGADGRSDEILSGRHAF